MIPLTSFTRRVLFALPVMLAAALVILATQSAEHGIALGVIVFVAALVGPRLRVTVESQHIVAGVALVPAALISLPFAVEVPGLARLAGAWCVAATWAVLACSTRLVMVDPAWGARSLLALGSVAVLLSGFARLSTAYIALSWAFVVACLGAMRAGDPTRPSLRRLSRREWAVACAVVAGTLGFSAASARGLPWVHEWLLQRYARSSEDVASSGFSPWLELGPLQSMALSEEMVLRVHGRAPEYLRGMVYDRYERGRWRNTHLPAVTIVRTPPGPLAGADVVTVERVGGLAGWYFLPLEARDVATLNGSLRRDGLGTVRGVPGNVASELWYRPGARDTLLPIRPTPADLEMPAGVRPVVTDFASRWAANASGSGARMAALRAHLRSEYRYSLRFARSPHVDPVVDFLTRHREGHCEYFASTLALLGRAAGVPTRVVGGYRVAERNPFGRYYVVREKNAHAWVEAWVDGAWRSFDATPSGAIPYNERHDASWLRALADFVALRVGLAKEWVAAGGTNVLLTIAGVLLVVWLTWRAWRARNEPALEADAEARSLRALPCLDALTAALADAGITRDGVETLERFATRVEESELPDEARVDVAMALRRYAALRYGAMGDEVDVARDVMRAAERVRSVSPREAEGA